MTPVFISRCGIKLEHFYRQTSTGIDIEYKQPFITLTDKILAAKQQQPPVSPFDKGDFDVNADTSALERQIDPVRCLLSNGVDQMVLQTLRPHARGDCNC